MSPARRCGLVPRAVVAGCAAFLAACGGGGGMATVASVAVAPMCTILGVVWEVDPTSPFNPRSSSGLIWERTDPTRPGGFRTFTSIAIQGNTAVGFRQDVYGISEAWLQTPTGPVVVNAEAHPARRPAFMDFDGSAWSLRAQNNKVTLTPGSQNTAFVTWSPVFFLGSANRGGNEFDSPESGGVTVPQLMRVGNANQQMFACVGGRSEDDKVRTTILDEVMVPTGNPLMGGGLKSIQDVLGGDDHFVPNAGAGGPLPGPSTPPTPTIHNRPGSPVTSGSVQCAMTQDADNVATRELHMLAIDGPSRAALYYSVASNFSTATTGTGSTFQRFNTVSPWSSVGLNFGPIYAAAITASRPTAISVFFVAGSGGRYRLFHTVRFANGSWRPPDDVLLLDGGSLNGTNFPIKVAAGMCPVLGNPQKSELVYAIWDEQRNINVGRIVSTPQLWPDGSFGTYSPLSQIAGPQLTPDPNADPSIQHGMNLVVATRPWSQSAGVTPPPP